MGRASPIAVRIAAAGLALLAAAGPAEASDPVSTGRPRLTISPPDIAPVVDRQCAGSGRGMSVQDLEQHLNVLAAGGVVQAHLVDAMTGRFDVHQHVASGKAGIARVSSRATSLNRLRSSDRSISLTTASDVRPSGGLPITSNRLADNQGAVARGVAQHAEQTLGAEDLGMDAHERRGQGHAELHRLEELGVDDAAG